MSSRLHLCSPLIEAQSVGAAADAATSGSVSGETSQGLKPINREAVRRRAAEAWPSIASREMRLTGAADDNFSAPTQFSAVPHCPTVASAVKTVCRAESG